MANKQWNSSVQFPTDSNFVNRIVDAKFGPSNSSGNPMITVEFEVVSPEEVEIAGEMYNIAGVKCKRYYVTQNVGDDEKTAESQKRVREFWSLLGLNPDEINWDNVDVKPLIGKCVLTMMEPDVVERRKNPTAAQIETAKKNNAKPLGDVMFNPLTKKPLVNYWPKVIEIFGLAPEQATGNPY